MTKYLKGLPENLGPADREDVRRLIEFGEPIAPPYPWHLRDKTRVFEYVASLGAEAHEWLLALYVDAHLNLLSVETVARGAVGEVPLSTAKVLRRGVLLEAEGFIIVHNHPSGNPRPSQSDVRATVNLARQADALGLVLIEHHIVARDGWASILWDGGGMKSWLSLVEKRGSRWKKGPAPK